METGIGNCELYEGKVLFLLEFLSVVVVMLAIFTSGTSSWLANVPTLPHTLYTPSLHLVMIM